MVLWFHYTNSGRDCDLDLDREQVHRSQWESVLFSVSVQCEQLHTILYNLFLICLGLGHGHCQCDDTLLVALFEVTICVRGICFAVCETLTQVTHCEECTDKTQSEASKCTACASGFTIKEDNSECLCKYNSITASRVSFAHYVNVFFSCLKIDAMQSHGSVKYRL